MYTSTMLLAGRKLRLTTHLILCNPPAGEESRSNRSNDVRDLEERLQKVHEFVKISFSHPETVIEARVKEK